MKIDERLGLRVALAAVVRLVESESGSLSLRRLRFSTSITALLPFFSFIFICYVCVCVEEANFWSGGKFWFLIKLDQLGDRKVHNICVERSGWFVPHEPRDMAICWALETPYILSPSRTSGPFNNFFFLLEIIEFRLSLREIRKKKKLREHYKIGQ